MTSVVLRSSGGSIDHVRDVVMATALKGGYTPLSSSERRPFEEIGHVPLDKSNVISPPFAEEFKSFS